MQKRIFVFVGIILGLLTININQNRNLPQQSISIETSLIKPKSAAIVSIGNDDELKTYCIYGDGISWNTAYNINHTNGEGIYINNTRKCVIIEECTFTFVYCKNATNILILNSTFGTTASPMYNIKFDNTTNCEIISNNLNSGSGIYCINSKNILIKSNKIQNGYNTVICSNIDGGTIYNNEISRIQADALSLTNVKNFNISFNEIERSSNGINIIGGSNNGLYFNTLSYNIGAGVKTAAGTNLAVYYNDFLYNAYGLNMVSGEGEKISYNLFLDNTYNCVYSGTQFKYIDDGTHGNYWSDYYIRNSNGNVTNGIYNVSYVLDEATGEDRFPRYDSSRIPSKPNFIGFASFVEINLVSLSWNPVLNARFYRIYINSSIYGTYPNSTTTVTLDLKNGDYFVSISCYNGWGESAISDASYLNVSAPIPFTLTPLQIAYIIGGITGLVSLVVVVKVIIGKRKDKQMDKFIEKGKEKEIQEYEAQFTEEPEPKSEQGQKTESDKLEEPKVEFDRSKWHLK